MEIVVLDGRDVPSPEDIAMLQSLYSRSPQSVHLHLEQVKAKGSARFHEQYYVGFAHKSIGDCGTTSIFVEDVSMLVAKAIQDNPLYSGQEASTRYLNMAEQPVMNPLMTPHGEKIQRGWIDLYKDVLDRLIPHFEKRFPREDGQKKSVWRKAIKARAFDVARGFLPAGCCTNVAWHTNLRQAADHLKLLRHSPCKEIRDVGARILAELVKKYPSSFSHEHSAEEECYLEKSVNAFAFYEGKPPLVDFRHFAMLDYDRLKEYQYLLDSRPPKTELHQRLRQCGMIQFEFPLDFGSYRDLQRHRSCVQDMPLLTTKHGIMPWYFEQLPSSIREVAEVATRGLERLITDLDLSPEEKQYYVAMGYRCTIRITCPLPSAVYIAELRSSPSVHPTLRVVAQKIGDTIQALVPGLVMYHDKSEGIWDIRRGEQDIVKVG